MGLDCGWTNLHSEKVHLAAQGGKLLRRRTFGGAGLDHLPLLGDVRLDGLQDLRKDVLPAEETVVLQALQAVAVGVGSRLQAVDFRQVLVEGVNRALNAPARFAGVLDDRPQVQAAVVNFGEACPRVDLNAVRVRAELDLIDESVA